MRRLVGVLAISVVAACSVGPRLAKVKPAHEPAGATLELRIHFGRGTQFVVGELLAVQDSGLLVRDSTRIVFVPNRAVLHGETVSSGGGVAFARKPSGAMRERLRLLSRYPGGVSADLLSKLLAAYGRDSVDTVR
jgi:hypothetical protein